jgi:hypothetical protein
MKAKIERNPGGEGLGCRSRGLKAHVIHASGSQ